MNFLPIPDDGTFEVIWTHGVFAAINAACGTRIDNYEEEVIEPDRLKLVTGVLEKLLKTRGDGPVRTFMVGLLALCKDAESRGRPVYFIL